MYVEGFLFCCCTFSDTGPLFSRITEWAHRQKSRFGPRSNAEHLLRHFVHRSPNFYGVKSLKFDLDSQPQSQLRRAGFESKQHRRNV